MSKFPVGCFRAICLALTCVMLGSAARPTSGMAQNHRLFDHVFIVVLENSTASDVLSIQYFNDLAKRGVWLSNSYSIGEPSQPNYVALIAGEPIVSDDDTYDLPQTNLVDLLEAANISWKVYVENYPGPCFAKARSGDSTAGEYARKHNPFISFDNIRTNPQRCSHIVNADQLAADIEANQLPQYSFYVPNENNDAHSKPLSYAAQWLRTFLDPKLAEPKFSKGTLVVVTFDEDGSDTPGQINIYTVLLGSVITPGTMDSTRYDHYSLLRTIEDNFNLGSLKRKDATAVPYAACNFTGGCNPQPAELS